MKEDRRCLIIKHEGLTYELTVTDYNVIGLTLLGGCTRKGRVWWCDDWGDPTAEYGDVQLLSNPMALLRQVRQGIIKLVYDNHLDHVQFSASTFRKAPIYDWFARKLAADLDVWYTYERCAGGTHSFQRRKQKKERHQSSHTPP